MPLSGASCGQVWRAAERGQPPAREKHSKGKSGHLQPMPRLGSLWHKLLTAGLSCQHLTNSRASFKCGYSLPGAIPPAASQPRQRLRCWSGCLWRTGLHCRALPPVRLAGRGSNTKSSTDTKPRFPPDSNNHSLALELHHLTHPTRGSPSPASSYTQNSLERQQWRRRQANCPGEKGRRAVSTLLCRQNKEPRALCSQC